MQSWWYSFKGRQYWAASRNIHGRDRAWCRCSQPHRRPDDRCARPFESWVESWQWRWPGWKEGLHRLPWQSEDAYFISAISYDGMPLFQQNYWGKMSRKTTLQVVMKPRGTGVVLEWVSTKQTVFACVVCMYVLHSIVVCWRRMRSDWLWGEIWFWHE